MSLTTMPLDLLWKIYTIDKTISTRAESLRLYRSLARFQQVSKQTNHLFEEILASAPFKTGVYPSLASPFSNLSERTRLLDAFIKEVKNKDLVSLSPLPYLGEYQIGFLSSSGTVELLALQKKKDGSFVIASTDTDPFELDDSNPRKYSSKIGYSGKDWIAVASITGSADNRLRIYSRSSKKEIKQYILDRWPSDLLMEEGELFVNHYTKDSLSSLAIYAMENLDDDPKIISLPKGEVLKFFFPGKSTIYLVCNSEHNCFLRAINKQNWELSHPLFSLGSYDSSKMTVLDDAFIILDKGQFITLERDYGSKVKQTIVTMKKFNSNENIRGFYVKSGLAYVMGNDRDLNEGRCSIYDFASGEKIHELPFNCDYLPCNKLAIAVGRCAPQFLVNSHMCHFVFVNTLFKQADPKSHSCTIQSDLLVKGIKPLA